MNGRIIVKKQMVMIVDAFMLAACGEVAETAIKGAANAIAEKENEEKAATSQVNSE